MSQKDKLVYINAVKDRYKTSTKHEKKIILDELCKICNYNRKYAIRLLNKPDKWIKRKKRGSKSKYDDKYFLKALKYIWKATDYICSKRLKAAIPLWLPFLETQKIKSGENGLMNHYPKKY